MAAIIFLWVKFKNLALFSVRNTIAKRANEILSLKKLSLHAFIEAKTADVCRTKKLKLDTVGVYFKKFAKILLDAFLILNQLLPRILQGL